MKRSEKNSVEMTLQSTSKKSRSKIVAFSVAGLSAVALIVSFQNCASRNVSFGEATLGSLGVCDGISCDLSPLTTKPAVTTILMALGDKVGDKLDAQLVVNGASAQLIAETIIRYSSPVDPPKILLIKDANSGSESADDTEYTRNVLLGRYDVTFMEEPADGVKLSDLMNYDVVWLNNPGNPMGSAATRDALLAFAGGVVIQGDDLSWGKNFSVEALTGLRYLDNGTDVSCGGKNYNHDNNNLYQFQVRLDATKIPGAQDATIKFVYGNDIDNTAIARPDLEVLAYAKGGHSSCVDERPAIVRYLKN